MEARNPRLERRLDAVRSAMHDLATQVDENLRAVLLLLTTDAEVAAGLALRPVEPAARRLMDACTELLGLAAPLARDLRWAMAMIRVGKDYERVQSLVGALHERVRTLSGTLLDEILHAMIEGMRGVLAFHAGVLELWTQPPPAVRVPHARLLRARAAIDRGLGDVEARAVAALVRGAESAENLRELVLASRHLERIAGTLAGMPGELLGVLAEP